MEAETKEQQLQAIASSCKQQGGEHLVDAGNMLFRHETHIKALSSSQLQVTKATQIRLYACEFTAYIPETV